MKNIFKLHLLILASALSLWFVPPVAMAGRLSPYPPNRTTIHDKEFDAITDFMKKHGFESDFWVTEPTAAPEFKWFYRVYSIDLTAKVLITMSSSGELQTKFFVRAAQNAAKEQMLADFEIISKELKRRYSR